jgi:tetratricopeptide (TPR) repeat protein
MAGNRLLDLPASLRVIVLRLSVLRRPLKVVDLPLFLHINARPEGSVLHEQMDEPAMEAVEDSRLHEGLRELESSGLLASDELGSTVLIGPEVAEELRTLAQADDVLAESVARAHRSASKYWLAQAEHESDLRARMKHLVEARFHEHALGDDEAAVRLTERIIAGFEVFLSYEEQKELASETLGWLAMDHPRRAPWLGTLGTIAYHRGAWDEAKGYYQESLATSRRHGDLRSSAVTCHQLGILSQTLEDYDSAIGFYQEAVNLSRAAEDTSLLAKSYHQLGTLFHRKERNGEARDWYEKSIQLATEIEDDWGLVATYNQLKNLAEDEGDSVSSAYWADLMREARDRALDVPGAGSQ